jgi:hypothetical protein
MLCEKNMRYLNCLLILLILFFSASAVNAQVLESDYGREEAVLGETFEVLGEQVEEEREAEPVAEISLMDVLAVVGGVVVIALIAYIIYAKREKED